MKLNEKEIRAAVKERYGDIADKGGSAAHQKAGAIRAVRRMEKEILRYR